jgi:uncharacterized membrane protein YjjB (DUF3815 family)
MITTLFAFIASAALAASFREPVRGCGAAGIAGALGWAAYHSAITYGHTPELFAAFLGAVTVGVASELMARYLKEPTVLFVIPGLIPLVPGLMAYNGMLALAREDYFVAGQSLTRTLFYAGALAAGLALPPAFFRMRRFR